MRTNKIKVAVPKILDFEKVFLACTIFFFIETVIQQIGPDRSKNIARLVIGSSKIEINQKVGHVFLFNVVFASPWDRRTNHKPAQFFLSFLLTPSEH